MSSSQVIASISRWFVGSSSSSRSGAETSARPSITRRRHPPDRSRMRRIAVELQARDDLIDLKSLCHRPPRRRARRPARSPRARHHRSRGHLLSEARDLARPGESTPRRLRNDLAANQLQQRGLALAVSPEQTDPLALADLADRHPSSRGCRPKLKETLSRRTMGMRPRIVRTFAGAGHGAAPVGLY